jgi:hypothetical protein
MRASAQDALRALQKLMQDPDDKVRIWAAAAIESIKQ